jgi:hypothetical protein
MPSRSASTAPKTVRHYYSDSDEEDRPSRGIKKGLQSAVKVRLGSGEEAKSWASEVDSDDDQQNTKGRRPEEADDDRGETSTNSQRKKRPRLSKKHRALVKIQLDRIKEIRRRRVLPYKTADSIVTKNKEWPGVDLLDQMTHVSEHERKRIDDINSDREMKYKERREMIHALNPYPKDQLSPLRTQLAKMVRDVLDKDEAEKYKDLFERWQTQGKLKYFNTARRLLSWVYWSTRVLYAVIYLRVSSEKLSGERVSEYLHVVKASWKSDEEIEDAYEEIRTIRNADMAEKGMPRKAQERAPPAGQAEGQKRRRNRSRKTTKKSGENAGEDK